MNKKFEIIGTGKIVDLELYFKWYRENIEKISKTCWQEHFYKFQNEYINSNKIFEAAFISFQNYNHIRDSNKMDKKINDLKAIDRYISSNNLAYNVIFEFSDYFLIQFGTEKNVFVILKDMLLFTPLKDYSEIPASHLKAIKGQAKSSLSLVSSPTNTLSIKQGLDLKDNIKSKVQQLMDESDLIKTGKTKDLEAIQKEIDEKVKSLEVKKKDLMDLLDAKKRELDNQLETLETQLFILESEIYSIRCFLGESFNLVKLRAGQNAKDETPMVLYQKFRFIDEELAKFSIINTVDYSKYDGIEELLTVNNDAFNTFCPSEKCIVLVKRSKNNTYVGNCEESKNILTNFEFLHGNQLGVIVRNGENLYIGWTDEEKISLTDNLFFSNNSSLVIEKTENKKEKRKMMNEIVSRLFIFSILQGLIEHKKIINFPEEISLNENSKYVVFSSADNSISDNRFGTLNDLVTRINPLTIVGDKIIALKTISCFSIRNNNERGIGYSNRNHDARISRGINVINKIKDSDFFISCEKEYSRAGARANVAIYASEFVNLTYFNSIWIEYFITNTQHANLLIDGIRIDITRLAQDLKLARNFIKDRELQESLIISKALGSPISEIKDWQVLLSEWKIKNKVRNINDFQAKRFIKTL